jgi:hypothetical protein
MEDFTPSVIRSQQYMDPLIFKNDLSYRPCTMGQKTHRLSGTTSLYFQLESLGDSQSS